MASSQSERTEKPTPRRRERAREEGKFAFSQELTSAITLAACLAAISYAFGSVDGFRNLFGSLLETAIAGPATEESVRQIIRKTGLFFFATVAPVLATATLASLAGSFAQGLPIFSANATGLKWENLNPIRGLSKLKAKVSWTEWLKILLLVTVATWAVWSTMSRFWVELVTLPAHDVSSSNVILRTVVTRLATYIVGAAVVIAVVDYFLQRRRFEKSLMMTKDEVREDMKSSDGNPMVKAKVRAIQRERSKRRMMARIKQADVIVTNPTHYAVALEYKPDKMAAPKVVAKGVDLLAQRIKEEGRKFDIPTVENVSLARALYSSVELEQEIPLDLYKAVAEVLAFVFKARKPM